jgi:hypothetical protein
MHRASVLVAVSSNVRRRANRDDGRILRTLTKLGRLSLKLLKARYAAIIIGLSFIF